MNLEGRFKAAEEAIGRGDTDSARMILRAIADDSPSDPSTLLKCASVMIIIDDLDGKDHVLNMVAASLEGSEDDLVSIASAMRGLGRPEESLLMLEGASKDDATIMEMANALQYMGSHAKALECLESLSQDDLASRLLKAEILTSLNRMDDAENELNDILSHHGPDYRAMINMSNLIIMRSGNKEAVRFVNSRLKEDKRNADMLALKAYVMRISGKTLAAINYSQKALKIDPKHIGALETMAYCLVEKGKNLEAKMLAGAIFQLDPGNQAVFLILEAARA